MANNSYVYLINPTFQFMNVSGKPLTGGYVNVYISGTRSKYYAFSDFDGTLHPFNIPLNALGSAVILVSPAHSYDLYVYNSVGTLQMSRYNITPATGDGTVITDVTTLNSKDGTVDITANSSTNYDFSIATKIAELKAYTDQAKNDAIESANTSIADLNKKKKDKQNELNFNGSATKTVKKITQYPNGELNVEFADIDLPGYKISSSDGSINVSTSEGVTDLTLPSDVVRDSAYKHIDAATANPLTDGTASVGISVKYAREDHVHPSDTSKEDIANKTTVVLGTSDSKYPTDKAVAEFVNSSISNSVDQTYSSTSTKAQSGVAVNAAFKTRETSSSDNSYTYLGMNWLGATGPSEEKLYWKLVSFKPINNYWTLQFEIDVCNGRKGDRSFDTLIYETKRLNIYGFYKDTVYDATELRYTSHSNYDRRGYGNNIYYEMDSSGTVTIYIYARRIANETQICRLTSVRNLKSISNITWYEPVGDAGTQPTNPIKFKEDFPAIASTSSNIGSDSVPVYVNRGKPVSCNSSNLKAGKDDDGNVIKNTYATKTELNAKQNSLTAGDNITIDSNTISSNQVFVATFGTTKYAEVKAAYDAGKICIIFRNDLYYYLNLIEKNRIRFISQTPNPVFGMLTVFSDDRWEASNAWLQSKLTFDAAPTAGSNNPVTSDGIKSAIDTVNAKGLTVKEISGEQVICFE